ncbi:MAG: hypothetical protein AAGB93_01315 [Planctomycetota bacterium]
MRLLVAALSLLALVSCAARSGDVAPSAVRTAWPDDWVGTWEGELVVEGDARIEPVLFRLEIGTLAESGVRPWRLTYGDAPTRDYRLVEVDAARGRWAIDEQNGIVLPARRMGDALIGGFSVGEQILVTHQRFHDDRIEHQILVVSSVGDATGGGVNTFPARGWQHATLRRGAPR